MVLCSLSSPIRFGGAHRDLHLDLDRSIAVGAIPLPIRDRPRSGEPIPILFLVGHAGERTAEASSAERAQRRCGDATIIQVDFYSSFTSFASRSAKTETESRLRVELLSPSGDGSYDETFEAPSRSKLHDAEMGRQDLHRKDGGWSLGRSLSERSSVRGRKGEVLSANSLSRAAAKAPPFRPPAHIEGLQEPQC